MTRSAVSSTVTTPVDALRRRGFIKAGFLDPHNLLFARDRVTRAREMAEQRSGEIDELDTAYGEIHREHPFQDGPDFVVAIRRLIDTPAFKFRLDFD